MSRGSIRERALTVGAEYNSLIDRLTKASDDFLRELDQSGIEAARSLIDSRAILCNELVQCGETLKPLVREIEQSACGIDAELGGVLADIRTNLRSLGEKQKTCEAALSARMDVCRTELTALRKHGEMCGAYRSSGREQHARFLDSKQ